VSSQSVAIVTGANSGIGFETTVGMARAGYHVVMACRNKQKADEAMAKVAKRVQGASLEVMLVDLGRFETVWAFADEYRMKHDRLDVLSNNAGILLYSPRSNADGIELQFATNHLGHFLLTSLLIDLMPDDPATRIVSLSSVGHKGARFNLGVTDPGGYGQSKLACLMFADELDRRLRKSGRRMKSLAVHPGASDSGLFDEMPRWSYYMVKLVSPIITHSNASAAKPSLHAALSPEAVGGEYYGPTGLFEYRGKVGIAKRDPYSASEEVARELWSLSERLTGAGFDV
jgi:NAD(P)-dependent dehydrogenase (short-subunit alcohol dehydrogenase family)